MDDTDDEDEDGMTRYRRRETDLDELLEIAARQLREAEQAKAQADDSPVLPAHPRFARYAGRMSDRSQDEWIDRMRNRFGGEW